MGKFVTLDEQLEDIVVRHECEIFWHVELLLGHRRKKESSLVPMCKRIEEYNKDILEAVDKIGSERSRELAGKLDKMKELYQQIEHCLRRIQSLLETKMEDGE